VKLLAWNPRDPGTYYYAWATLAMEIIVVVMLAMQLWTNVVIASVFLVICAGLAALRSPSNSDDGEDNESP
jgi:hypothetical protein